MGQLLPHDYTSNVDFQQYMLISQIRHLTLLCCIVRYSLSYLTFNYYSRWAQFSYRTAFISAAVTYGIVVYKAFRARARAGSNVQGGVLGYLADENVQYLGTSPIASLQLSLC
jgi:hypothetical protein